MLALALAAGASAQPLRYDGADLRDVIADAERRTDWRFLYADALVAGRRVSLRADAAGLPDALARALAAQGVGVEADPERRRILLVPAPPQARSAAPPAERVRPERVVRGRVLDAETGLALPFATVTWRDGRRGVVADVDGGFWLTLRDAEATGRTVLVASFVGYRPQAAAPAGRAVTFRLAPEAVAQAAVVVDGFALAALDTAWAARVQPGRFDALADGGGVRALGILPSVAPSGLFGDATVVRGSPSDAFEVRLDGVPIYNPSHLFGLADAFNGDALRAVALHVGVAPARVAVSPGGALDYVTATGSPRAPTAQAGVSSLAARGALSAPLRTGRTTALVGGRRSLLGALPWTDGLVEHGLGVARPTSALPAGTADAGARVVRVTATDAAFWDLHAALADDRADGGRTAWTAYAGGDETRLDALRLSLDDSGHLAEAAVATRNRWGSRATSLTDRRPLSSRAALTTTLGGSLYDARFGQSDFAFRRPGPDPLAVRFDTLGYDNGFGEAVAAQRLDAAWRGGVLSGGYRVHLYRQRYRESARERPVFESERAARRLDVHAAWDGAVRPGLDLDAGLRAHAYSGADLRVSPRLRVRWRAAPDLSLSAAVGRSVQVAHRLTLDAVAGASAWVLSDSGETITEADLAEASLDARLGGATLSLAAYAKTTRGLWLYAEGRDVRQRAGASVLTRPWLTGVDGRAQGVEALARVPFGPWSVGASAAWARADLGHPALDGGQPFPAAWDRRVRVTLLADGPVLPGVRLAAAWTVASGVPNPLADVAGEADRLGPLSRLDLRLVARRQIGGADAALALAVRNVLDADNAVTREATPVVRRAAGESRRLGVVPLDIYDAGVLPTLDLSVRW